MSNLKDGAAWGIFPLYYRWLGLAPAQATALIALYPATWGLSQLATGWMSDRWGRLRILALGFVMQAVAFAAMALALPRGPDQPQLTFALSAGLACLLGLGSGMVHPTLMAAVGDAVPGEDRAASLGVYRMWRDGGYAVGAITAGALVDHEGVRGALLGVGCILAASLVGLTAAKSTPPP